jgi:ectoine hydroxylase-related dioxygenase (phytanoyl-CoA dioxygenase family)
MIGEQALKQQVLIDNELNKQLRQNGYVVISEFLSEDEVGSLLDYYEINPSELRNGFHTTLHSKNAEYRKSVTQRINTTFFPKAEKILLKYRPVFSCFTVKEPDSGSAFDLHLDWSMVDENEFTSITIWVPLVPLTENNGQLYVLKGSNNFEYTIRGGPGLKLWCSDPSRVVAHTYPLERLKLNVGDAVVYDHRLFHGSPPNLSDTRRIAINYSTIPFDARSIHYRFEHNDAVTEHESPVDFYHEHILDTPPQKLLPIKKIPIKGGFLQQSDVNKLTDRLLL